MQFKFSANTQTYSSKPSKKEAAKISNNMESVYTDTIKDFSEDLGKGIS